MRQLVERESQFIVATHSPILMAYPGAKILVLDEKGFTETAYERTEHFEVTRQFLNDPAGMVENLRDD